MKFSSELCPSYVVSFLPRWDVVDVLVVVALEHLVGNSLEGPSFVATFGDLASEADLLKVGRAVSGGQ